MKDRAVVVVVDLLLFVVCCAHCFFLGQAYHPCGTAIPVSLKLSGGFFKSRSTPGVGLCLVSSVHNN